jgi:hypothetical protein
MSAPKTPSKSLKKLSVSTRRQTSAYATSIQNAVHKDISKKRKGKKPMANAKFSGDGSLKKHSERG